MFWYISDNFGHKIELRFRKCEQGYMPVLCINHVTEQAVHLPTITVKLEYTTELPQHQPPTPPAVVVHCRATAVQVAPGNPGTNIHTATVDTHQHTAGASAPNVGFTAHVSSSVEWSPASAVLQPLSTHINDGEVICIPFTTACAKIGILTFFSKKKKKKRRISF